MKLNELSDDHIFPGMVSFKNNVIHLNIINIFIKI